MPGTVVLAAAVLALFTVAPGARQLPVPGLTGTAEISRAYDAIFDARFADVPPLLAKTCPPAPHEACLLLDAVNTWWQIQLDPYNRTRDATLESRIATAVTAIEAWTMREALRAEAWFYLGGAYGTRVQLRVLRGARLTAARDGARIKEALERALALDASMADAHFGVGLYHYYAAVAPVGARMLRWLLLLPGGDRVKGLQEMGHARAGGLLVRDEAEYQLHTIYLWYEKQPQRALELLSGLIERHPRNPHFRQAKAEILDFYLDDTEASLRTWHALLDAASRREVEEPQMAEANARLGVASQLDQLSQSDAALEHLRSVIATNPAAPVGAVARAQFQLGNALEHLGRHAEASAAYRAAINAAGAHDPLRIAERARAAMRAQR